MNHTTNVPDDDPYPFEDFAPTLAQCFFITIAGYSAAKFELLSSSDIRGVSLFAAYFAMPGIICISLADADFRDFRWELLIGIFFGKAIVFISVAGISFLLNRNIGTAGMIAIFCVHTNDLPVGNPLMTALYKEVRPQMMKYLFLIPALTVIFFVPVGNFMIKFRRSQRDGNQDEPEDDRKKHRKSWKEFLFNRECRQIAHDAILNPVIFATSMGLILNCIFKGKLPGFLHKPIHVVAATIPGLALSILGFNMVRKERYLISSSIVPAIVLVIVKMFFTPLVLHSVTRVLTTQSKSFKLLSDFALLYGVLSPATAVFQSGQEFRKPLAAMSAALILSSFTSFPVSYIVARYTIAPAHKLSTYIPTLRKILLGISCFSIFCDIFVLISIIRKKQFLKFPCCYIVFLAFTQLILFCGMIFWSLNIKAVWSVYVQMALFYGGKISGYLWTGTTAVALILNRRYPLLAEKGYSILFFTVFSLSALITTVMCILISFNDIQMVYVVGRARSNFEFLQLILMTILLGFCLLAVGAVLILQFKRRKLKSYTNFDRGHDNAIFTLYPDEEKKIEKEYQRRPSSISIQYTFSENAEVEFYYTDVVKDDSRAKLFRAGEDWSFRTNSLLLMLWLVMVIKFVSNLFKVTRSESLEIMVPLEFLQSSLYAGQGIFMLLTFGIDTRSIIISSVKRWRKFRYGKEEFVVSTDISKKKDADIYCSQFYKYFYERCFQDLSKERKWKDNSYKNSFWGHQLVDWLIEESVAKNNLDAEEYGQKLLTGGLISHVRAAHNFYDAPYLYYFVKSNSQSDA